MRYALAFVALALTGAALFSGCGDTATEPELEGFSLQGTIAAAGSQNLSQATVQLFAAAQDAAIADMLTEYPSVGFSLLPLMLFDPLTQEPISTSNPNNNGDFRFEALPQGNYIVDAQLSAYACSEPAFINLTDESNIGTLLLSPQQEVEGNLQTSTWQTGEVFMITGDIVVPPDAVLTIQPGVLILLDGDYALTVMGGLQVEASPTRPVRFRLTPDHYLSGGDWAGIRLENPTTACTLTGLTIQGSATAVKVSGGQALISECLLDAPGAYGAFFSAGASGGVQHCIVRDGDTGLTASYADPEFSHNLILDMTGAGIELKDTCQAEIFDNIILNCQTGIWSDWRTAPLIHYNLISGGQRALDAQRGISATIRYNEFRDQTLEGVRFHNGYCYSLLENNNFINMPQIILNASSGTGTEPDTIQAPYNYWDGEDGAGIPLRIIDGYDVSSPGSTIDVVEFEPYRLDPVPGGGP